MSAESLGTIVVEHFPDDDLPWRVRHMGDDRVPRGEVRCPTIAQALGEVARYASLHLYQHLKCHAGDVV